MYKLFAILIGFLITVMVSINGKLASFLGDYTSVLVIHMVGLVSISLILLTSKKRIRVNKGIPIYLFAGGAVGVFVVLFNNICFKNLGVSLTLALGLLGQSIASGIIDHFGLFGMTESKFKPKKFLGFGLIAIGIAIMFLY